MTDESSAKSIQVNTGKKAQLTEPMKRNFLSMLEMLILDDLQYEFKGFDSFQGWDEVAARLYTILETVAPDPDHGIHKLLSPLGSGKTEKIQLLQR